MNTDTTPYHPAVRVIGRALLVAGLSAGAILTAQQPVPPAPALVQPTAEPPAPSAPAPRLPTTLAHAPASAGVAPAPSLPTLEPPVLLLTPPPGAPTGAPGALPVPTTPRLATRSASSGAVSIDARPRPGTALPGKRGSAGISGDSRPRSGIGLSADNAGRIRSLARTVVDEELSADPQDPIGTYEAIIADFDHQRENAAQAVFRLGEAYRKLGRLEEARVQFARVLREFVDFPDLARLSQLQLAQNTQREARAGNAPNLPSPPAAEERSLIEEELSLLGQQLARAQDLVKTGTTPDSSLFPIQRDILHLKQQLARLSHDSDHMTAPTSSVNHAERAVGAGERPGGIIPSDSIEGDNSPHQRLPEAAPGAGSLPGSTTPSAVDPSIGGPAPAKTALPSPQ